MDVGQNTCFFILISTSAVTNRQNNITEERSQISKDDCGCNYDNSPDSLPVDLPINNNCKENPWEFPPTSH